MREPRRRHIKTSRPLFAILPFVFLLTQCEAAWLTAPDGSRVFLRGVGFSPYHPRDKWNLSPAIRARDRALIRALNANCLARWGEPSYEDADAWRKLGVYTLPQVAFSPPHLSVFANGYPAPVPIYVNEDNRRGFHDAARDMAGALKDNPGVLAISLGNNYAWSAYSGDLGFTYGGFDDETLAAFRLRIKTRFPSLDQFQSLVDPNAKNLDDVLPVAGLTPSPMFWEWWLFMREAFAGYLDAGRAGVRALGSDCPLTYAQPRGVRWDPASEGDSPPTLDIVSGNIFHEHTLDWGKFCVAIDRLISAAHGRPVLLSETGVHTLYRDEAQAARILKQSIACALLHPELAGLALHEFCDEWQLSGKTDTQDMTNNKEHWGLVTAHRVPKQTYRAAAHMFAFIERFETMFQEWQSPPMVYLSRQDLDWWKIGGVDGVFFERVAAQLYRHGVSFQLLDTEGLLQLTPKDNPRLILCDSYLASDPDGTGDVQGRIISYIESGGNVLYISRMPWQTLYGRTPPPAELRPEDKAPLSRSYGEGRCTLLPSYDLKDQELSYLIEDYLGDLLVGQASRLSRVGQASRLSTDTFWRIFQDRAGLWLFAVNVGEKPIPRLDIALGEGMDAAQVTLKASDGARVGHIAGNPSIIGLNTYALVFLGAPLTPPVSDTPTAPHDENPPD